MGRDGSSRAHCNSSSFSIAFKGVAAEMGTRGSCSLESHQAVTLQPDNHI